MGFDSVPVRVSAHGGHSGQFCLHAKDELEAIVQAYIEQGFVWVGITEHMPPLQDQYRYADEIEAGISALALQQQFAAYAAEVHRLKQLYRDDILLLAGMEGECYPGAFEYALGLQQRYALDYIVGSVHHVRGINFDFCPLQYQAAIAACGDIDTLYNTYFDEQFAMLKALCPAVVGHFDLVRLYDPDYAQRLLRPEIMRRIERNLKFVRDNNLCLDLNVRALVKGASEPYISHPILVKALDMGVKILPGDDSHGVSDVGRGLDVGIALLQTLGYRCTWSNPADFIRSRV